MARRRLILLALLVACAAACEPRPPAGCPSLYGTDAGDATRTYALTLGTTGTSSTIAPWRDGDVVPLEHGLQGGYMARPTLDIDTVDVPTSDCFHVHVTNNVADHTAVRQYDAYVHPDLGAGPHVYRIEILDLLTFDPADVEGKTVTLDVSVSGTNGNGTATVTVTPRTSP